MFSPFRRARQVFSMSTSVSTMELRSKLGEVLDRTLYRKEAFVVERKGRPLAAIVPMEQYEQMRMREERFDRNLARVRECFADLSSEEVEQLVDEAVKAVRREKRAEAAAK
jgi:prevent-host-death family protein